MSTRLAPEPAARAGAALPPRVAPARRRSVPLAGLGVLLVVLGALGAWQYASAVGGDRHAYLAVARSVPAGTRIEAQDLQTVSIPAASGLDPVAASRSATIVGRYAAVDLVPGTLLTPADVTATHALAQGQALVGLDLPAGRRPGRTLRPGDHVLLIAVPPQDGADPSLAALESPPTGTAATGLPPNLPATVVEVSAPDTQGAAVVDVAIPVADAAGVTAYASRDLVAVVLVAGG